MVELIVVLVIVVILAAVAVPLLLGYIDDSREKKTTNRAEIARKTTQAALTSLYNDGGYRFTDEMRDAVRDEVGEDVSKAGTAFEVWTVKALGDSSTPATIENVGAYTISRAYYQESDTVYVFFKDGSWEYASFATSEKADEAVTAFKAAAGEAVMCDAIATGYSSEDFGMIIWSDTGIGADYANRTDPVQTDAYNWNVGGNGGGSDAEKNLTLKGFLVMDEDSKPHGVYFKKQDGSCSDSVELLVKQNYIDNYWMDIDGHVRVIDKNNAVWELYIDSTGIDFLGWDYGEVKNGRYLDAVAHLNGEPDEDFQKDETIFIAYYMPYSTKWVRFYAKNPNTLSGIADTAEGYIQVGFRKYQAEWCETYSVNQSVTDGTSDWSRLDGVDVPANLQDNKLTEPTAELVGWACKTGDTYGDILSTEEAVWDYVWHNRGGTEASPFSFYGAVKINALIVLESNELSRFQSGETTSDYFVKYNELTGKTVSAPDFSAYADNPIVVNDEEKDTFYGWNQKVNGTIDRSQVYSDLVEVAKFFTENNKLLDLTYTFVARVLDTGRAKFKGGTDDKDYGTLRGQLFQMANGTKTNLKKFERVQNLNTVESYYAGKKLLNSVGAFDRNLKLTVNGREVAYTRKGTGGYYQIDDGNVYRFFVIYDGSETDYTEPIFGYSVPNSGGGYNAYWFTKDPNPALVGNFTSCFDGYTNLGLNDQTDLESWDTTLCTNMTKMFYNCKFEGIELLNLSDWNTASVTNMLQMFAESNIKKISMDIDASSLDFPLKDGVSTPKWDYGTRQMFQRCRSLTEASVTFENTDKKLGIIATEMFIDCTVLAKVDLGTDPICIYAARGLFMRCSALKSVSLSVDSRRNTTTVDSLGNFRQVFEGCTSLKKASLDIWSSEDGPICLRNLFYGCSSLESVNFGDRTIYLMMGDDKDKDFSMFYGCANLTSVSMKINTANSYTYNREKTERVPNNTYFTRMFYNCTSLKSVSLQGDFSGVIKMDNMLYNTPNLTSFSLTGLEEGGDVSFESLSSTDGLSKFMDGSTHQSALVPSFLSSFSHWKFAEGFNTSNASANFMNAASRTVFINYIQEHSLEFKDGRGNEYTISTQNKLIKTN